MILNLVPNIYIFSSVWLFNMPVLESYIILSLSSDRLAILVIVILDF